MALVRIDNLAGIPLFYDRFNATAYGNEAVKMRPFIDDDFRKLCDSCFDNLQNLLSGSGFKITQIWSGGVGRSGNGASYHHKNRAFDLDALIFSDKPKWVADTFPERPFIYLAIEACLRQEFGTVLSYDYNAAHEDHFHFDNGTTVKFKKDARSHTLFLQHTLTQLFNQDIGEAGVDGVYGPDTDGALTRARQELSIGGLSDKANWLAYLRACASTAISNETSIVTA